MSHERDPNAVEEARTRVEKAYAAWRQYSAFSQEQIDSIVEGMAAGARDHARRLAELAVEETGYGNVDDKVAKNLLCADWLPRAMRGMKTVGLLREIPDQKIVEYGVPMGVVAAIIPTTNPTSTAIYKILISLKAGNAVVISPHPSAKRCTSDTAGLLYGAALQAGAPPDIIQCLSSPTLDATRALMQHDRTAVILATGGHGMVRAAYSSGKPAFGVGPGNVAVLVDRTANIPDTVAKIILGKSFDYGTVCSSEQALVAEQALRATILSELKARKTYLCNEEQKEALGKLLITPNWTVNPKCVGQPAAKIAEMAGFTVPADTTILTVELEGVGKQHPLSAEKLSPVLSLYFAKDFGAALDTCEALTRFGGVGHTCVIYSKDESRIREFAMRMPAMRVLVNTPAPHGSVGLTTNVFPSMTLGCGAAGGNITGDNVGPQHLINIKRLAYAVRQPDEALQIPGKAEEVAASSVSVAMVDRFLASRQATRGPDGRRRPPAGESGGQAPSSCDLLSCAPPAALPPLEAISIADFVCENDVRDALRQSAKIYIGPKTIVTPAARDLGERENVLVMTQR